MASQVSIGMPVHNGANYIKEAMDSILAQTFSDFELIISDNASTDETEQICRQYAAKDCRIRYYRQEANLGAAKNFNRTLELSSGRYFKWAAHDDMCAPHFLECCAEVLNRDESVVLCYPRTIMIDEILHRTVEYNDEMQLLSASPHERYKRYHKLARTYRGRECHPVFGLIRADALRKTLQIGNFVSSDLILLGELALYGRFFEVPEYLFFKRHHSNTSMKAYQSYRARCIWFDPSCEGRLQLVRWRWLTEYIRGVNRAPIETVEKALCYIEIGKWCCRNGLLLCKDLVKAAVWPFLPLSFRSPLASKNNVP